MVFIAENIQAHNGPKDEGIVVYDRPEVFSNSPENQAVPKEESDTARARIIARRLAEVETKMNKLEELANVPFYRPNIWLPHTYKNMPTGTTPKIVGWFGFIAAGFLYLGKDLLK